MLVRMTRPLCLGRHAAKVSKRLRLQRKSLVVGLQALPRHFLDTS